MLFRLWIIVTVLWEAYWGILWLGVEHFHNPRDAEGVLFMASWPLFFLALGKALQWAFAAKPSAH